MAEEASRIVLKINAQDGTTIIFRVHPNTVMKEIFKAYSTRKQMEDYRVFRFLVDGRRLSSKKTANELGLVDGDEIDAMLYQDGGGPAYY